MTERFISLTELAGSKISQEQLQRMVNRYVWAAGFCAGKDVLEAACGTGQGLALLARVARSLVAGDYSPEILAHARKVHGQIVSLEQFDARALPFDDASFDVVILFEALYYIPDPDRFFTEAKRVLRPGGVLLIATANKDLYDFNPSPHSCEYLGNPELRKRLAANGFAVSCFGDTPVYSVSWRQKVLRPLKALAVALGLMPRTAPGKVWLKRLVFGKLLPMPDSLEPFADRYVSPTPIENDLPDREHKVIFCVARLPIRKV